MNKKNTVLLISAILSLMWMIFCTYVFLDGLNGGNSDNAAEAIGTAIGAALLLPYIITAWIGTIFNCIGWLINKKGFALTAGILFCVSLLLGITYGFGLIPSIILSFIAYGKMGHRPSNAPIETATVE